MAKQEHKPKQERFQEVITAMLIIQNRGQGITAGGIAKQMKMATSTYLRNIIKEVVDSGYAASRNTTHWNGWKRTLYEPSHHKLNDECADWYHKTMAQHDLCMNMGISEDWQND